MNPSSTVFFATCIHSNSPFTLAISTTSLGVLFSNVLFFFGFARKQFPDVDGPFYLQLVRYLRKIAFNAFKRHTCLYKLLWLFLK